MGTEEIKQVIWGQTIPVPQTDDPDFGIPFCTLADLDPDAIPDKLQLLKSDGETLADTRAYTHFNLLGSDEMGDQLPAALDKRVQELGETQDLMAIGDGPSLETSSYIAIFMASKVITE